MTFCFVLYMLFSLLSCSGNLITCYTSIRLPHLMGKMLILLYTALSKQLQHMAKRGTQGLPCQASDLKDPLQHIVQQWPLVFGKSYCS